MDKHIGGHLPGINNMTPQGTILSFPQRSLTYMGCSSKWLYSQKRLIRKTVLPFRIEIHFKSYPCETQQGKVKWQMLSFSKLTFLSVKYLTSILVLLWHSAVLTLKVMSGVGNPEFVFDSSVKISMLKQEMALWLWLQWDLSDCMYKWPIPPMLIFHFNDLYQNTSYFP